VFRASPKASPTLADMLMFMFRPIRQTAVYHLKSYVACFHISLLIT